MHALRLAALSLLLLLWPILASPADAAAPAFRFGCNATTGAVSASTITCTIAGTVNPGDLVVMFAAYSASTSRTVTCTDTNNASGYTTIQSQEETTDPNASALCYKPNVTGGVNPVMTVTFSGAAVTFRAIGAMVYSGAALTGVLDQSTYNSQVAPGTGANAVTSGNITTAGSNELLVGCVLLLNAANETLAAGTGFNQREYTSTGAFNEFMCEDKSTTTPGTYAATFTLGASGADNTGTTVASFFPLSTGVHNHMLLGVGQ